MKIVHIVPHIDKEAAGPSYSVPRLCESLAARGHDIELSCLAARSDVKGVRIDLHRQWDFLSRFAISPTHAQSLASKARKVDIVHNHSLWSFINVAAGWVVPRGGAKLVVSPRGTLSQTALRQRAMLKQLLWPFQARILRRADLLHATSEEEYRDIRRHGFTAPVAVIPNGIDLPQTARSAVVSDPKTLLYLGRLHPIKCVDNLLAAWSNIQRDFPDWELRIIGAGSPDYECHLHEFAEEMELERTEFLGPLYGDDKTGAYRSATIYILPSSSENFGMTVAEALASGLPVIAGTGTPWQGLEAEGCGWWRENSVRSLTLVLREALSSPLGQLAIMGRRARAWMERDFGWLSIAERMDLAYRWIVEGEQEATRPGWVRPRSDSSK